MKDTLPEMKNTLEGINRRVGKAEDQISNLDDMETENTQSEQKKKGIQQQKNEDSLRNLRDNLKHTNIHIKGMPEGEKKKRKQGIEILFEKIMTGNFSNLVKEINIQVREAQRILKNMNPKRPTPRHIINKTAKFKDKERILKAAREKQLVTYKEAPIRYQLISQKQLCRA